MRREWGISHVRVRCSGVLPPHWSADGRSGRARWICFRGPAPAIIAVCRSGETYLLSQRREYVFVYLDYAEFWHIVSVLANCERENEKFERSVAVDHFKFQG